MDEQRQTATQPDSKRSYRTPELKEWGTITELTASGQTNTGGDVMCGSVFPGGQTGSCEA